MPTVTSAVIDDNVASGAADRLEIMTKIILSDGVAKDVKFHTSIKKHMLYSYLDGDDAYAPTPAAINTIAKINDGLFRASFREYVRHMLGKMRGCADYTAFKPSEAAHAMANPSKGVKWGNDTNRIGSLEVHCYPVQSPEAVEFNRQEFVHFIKLMKFMYHATDADRRRSITDAVAGWTAIEPKLRASQLLSDIQLIAIGHKLQNAEAARLATIAKMTELGQAAKAISQRPAVAGAPAFRGTG